MAQILRADGTEDNLPIVTLGFLQKIVGGYIEVVELSDGRLMILDEEGKLKGKNINQEATQMTRGLLSNFDVIVGDVVILTAEEAADF